MYLLMTALNGLNHVFRFIFLKLNVFTILLQPVNPVSPMPAHVI